MISHECPVISTWFFRDLWVKAYCDMTVTLFSTNFLHITVITSWSRQAVIENPGCLSRLCLCLLLKLKEKIKILREEENRGLVNQMHHHHEGNHDPEDELAGGHGGCHPQQNQEKSLLRIKAELVLILPLKKWKFNRKKHTPHHIGDAGDAAETINTWTRGRNVSWEAHEVPQKRRLDPPAYSSPSSPT